MTITAFAPASSANVFVGFDILGLAIAEFGDHVSVTKTCDETRITQITGLSQDIPLEVSANTAGKAILSLLERSQPNLKVEIKIHKGIPLASGLGGSAASAVAAVVAVNQLLDDPLPKSDLLDAALQGERIASGSIHGDNAAASLYGGLISALQSSSGFDILSLPIPDGLELVVIHPDIKISTRDARAALSNIIDLSNHIAQNMDLIRFISACYENDLDRFGQSLRDELIEPQRAHLIPRFYALKELSAEYNSLGFTISGAGPSMLACFDNPQDSKAYVQAVNNYDLPYTFQVWQSEIDMEGAKVVTDTNG